MSGSGCWVMTSTGLFGLLVVDHMSVPGDVVPQASVHHVSHRFTALGCDLLGEEPDMVGAADGAVWCGAGERAPSSLHAWDCTYKKVH